MAGSEPPDRSGAGGPGDEGGAHRWHDRDTEPIPRARNDVPPPEPEPVYEEVEGWPGSTHGARSWADLPARAIKYVRRVEELIRCPVALVSTSPERDDTILVRDPFAG